MVRNILAVSIGIVTYYLLLVISILLKMNIGSSPLYNAFTAYKTGHGELFAKLLEKSLLIDVLLIYPIISFISAFVTGLITRRSKYLMGGLTIIPYYIVLYLIPFLLTFSGNAFFYSVAAIFTLSTSSILGTYVSKKIRKKVN